jgi:hypothetical protein
VYSSSSGQSALVWVFWAIVDLPVSLLYLAAPLYSRFIHSVISRDSLLDHILYLPHIIHGVFGTAWWYLLVRFATRVFLRRKKAKSQSSLEGHEG